MQTHLHEPARPGKHFRFARTCVALLWALGFAPSLTGCADMFPDWCHPGFAQVQRKQAQRFDPYPEPDMGPDMAGARPGDFDKPRPEVQRAQNPRSFNDRYGQPPPMLYGPNPADPTGAPAFGAPAP